MLVPIDMDVWYMYIIEGIEENCTTWIDEHYTLQTQALPISIIEIRR